MTLLSHPDESLERSAPLRITYVVHHYPPAYRAGAELYTQRVACWMQAQGHDVDVVTIESITEGSSSRVEATLGDFDGIPVYRLRFKLVGAPDELIWRFDNPLLEQWFADYLVQRKPDFVHFMAGYLVGAGPLRAVRAAGVPMALTLHDYWFVCPRHTLLRGDGTLCAKIPAAPSACARCIAQGAGRVGRADKLTAGLYSTLLERFGLALESDAIAQRRVLLDEAITWPDIVIAPTRFLAGKISENLPSVTIRHIPHGYDPRPASSAHKSAEVDRVDIGYLGQIAPHKGVHVLVEAFRTLDPATASLHIYGILESNPAYASTLRRLAVGAENIHFHGGYDHQALPDILGSLDGVVVPSIWYENSPLVIIESLTSGVPVVTSGLGGMAELVEDGRTGLHFATGDVADLAATLGHFVADGEMRSRLRANAAAKGWRSVASEMNELVDAYRTTLASKPHESHENLQAQAPMEALHARWD